jgi:hypothetical protein
MGNSNLKQQINVLIGISIKAEPLQEELSMTNIYKV